MMSPEKNMMTEGTTTTRPRFNPSLIINRLLGPTDNMDTAPNADPARNELPDGPIIPCLP